MQTIQCVLNATSQAADKLQALVAMKPNLVFVFGAPQYFESCEIIAELSDALVGVPWLGCSTAGEIFHTGVGEDSLVVTGLRFTKPVSLRLATSDCPDMSHSRAAGVALATQLAADDLAGVFLLAPGVHINGSEVIVGARSALNDGVRLSGGLAGDGAAFVRTFTVLNGVVSQSSLVGVGLGGPNVRFLNGSYGGWNPFGPLRTVTRSTGNILFEMDGEPALALYKRYLGEYASGLPATGLLFPLAIIDSQDESKLLIRTLIGVDEAVGSLIFAGDIPPGAAVRMMQASVNSLVDGAQTAAETAASMMQGEEPGLALLVSCVGRKLVMAGRTEEEVEAVADAFGRGAMVTGFYSHGEISPGAVGTDCHLHNQTMTVTYLSEK